MITTYDWDFSLIKPEEVKAHQMSGYNRSEWGRIVDRYMRAKDVLFWIHEEKDGDKIYVEYTITEAMAVEPCDVGLRLLKQVQYHGILTNTGFVEVDILPGFIEVTYMGPKGERIADTEDNRTKMAEWSKQRGKIFTKLLFPKTCHTL